MIGTLHETIYPARGQTLIAEYYATSNTTMTAHSSLRASMWRSIRRAPRALPARHPGRQDRERQRARCCRCAPIRFASIQTRQMP